MYIYNTTFVCDDSRIEEFLMWADAEFVPIVTASGVASDVQLAQVLPVNESDEAEASSFSIQVRIESLELIEEWMHDSFCPAVSALSSRFGDKVLYFPTILEVLPLNRYN